MFRQLVFVLVMASQFSPISARPTNRHAFLDAHAQDQYAEAGYPKWTAPSFNNDKPLLEDLAGKSSVHDNLLAKVIKPTTGILDQELVKRIDAGKLITKPKNLAILILSCLLAFSFLIMWCLLRKYKKWKQNAGASAAEARDRANQIPMAEYFATNKPR